MFLRKEMDDVFLAGLSSAQRGISYSSGISPGIAETSVALYIIASRAKRDWEYEKCTVE